MENDNNQSTIIKAILDMAPKLWAWIIRDNKSTFSDKNITGKGNEERPELIRLEEQYKTALNAHFQAEQAILHYIRQTQGDHKSLLKWDSTAFQGDSEYQMILNRYFATRLDFQHALNLYMVQRLRVEAIVEQPLK